MHTTSLSKLLIRKHWNKKGLSSIVGAIFMIMIVMVLASAFFMFTLSQNSNYNDAVRTINQADIDRLNEKVLANVTAHSINNNSIVVNGTLENVGGLAATVNTLWVVDSTTSQFNSTSPLNIALKSGNITTLSGPTALTVPLTNSPKDKLVCWFITSRGNTISQYSLVLANADNANVTNVYTSQNITNVAAGNNTYSNSSTYSQVSQGIGLIAFDFKGFSHQDLITQPNTNNFLLSNLVKTYTLSQSHYIVMHVSLTNWDPAQQIMYINPGSSVYYVGSHSGTTKYNSWNLVNVTGSASTGWYLNDRYQNPYSASYVLPYGVPVDVFFAGVGNLGGSVDPNVYPLNVMVYGKLATSDYGQNIPFVAAYIE